LSAYGWREAGRVYCGLVYFHYYSIELRTAREHAPVFFLRYLKLYEYRISCIYFLHFFPQAWNATNFVLDVLAFLASTQPQLHSLAEEDDDEENVDDPLSGEDEADDKDDDDDKVENNADNDTRDCLKLVFRLI